MTTTPADRIETIRKELELNYSELGTLAGASKSVVNQWKTGNIKSISPKYAYRLDEQTVFNAKWIMLGSGPDKKTVAAGTTRFIARKALPPLELQNEVVSYLSGMDADDVDVWIATIKASANKARKNKQEKSNRELAPKALDPPSEERRTA